MLDHYKSYALAYTLAPNLLQHHLQLTNVMPLSDYNKLLTVCIQVICLSMSISKFRRTSNAVCCKVILFPETGLPLSVKRYGTETGTSRLGLAIVPWHRRPPPSTNTGAPWHLRNFLINKQ